MNAGIMATLFATALCGSLIVAVAYAWWLVRAPASEADDPGVVEWPAIDVIVAVFNECRLLRGKLENLSRLAYAGPSLRFIVVDGASTDGSYEIARDRARGDGRFLVLRAGRPGKAAQLNLALRHARGPWVVITDVDARMRPETIQLLMAAASRDPALGLVGSPVIPVRVHPAEQLYWRMLNWLRLHEWRRGSSSLVTAPCYAVKRALIDQLPDDVVSDDVYVAWRIGSLGHRIGLAGPLVHEVRGPATSRGLFRQKVRRGAGVIREVVRFIPSAPSMTAPVRAAFFVRAVLFLLAPLVVTSAIALGCVLLWRLPPHYGGGAVLLLAAVTSWLTRPSRGNRFRTPLGLVMLLTLSAAASLVVYPFCGRDGSSGPSSAWLFRRSP